MLEVDVQKRTRVFLLLRIAVVVFGITLGILWLRGPDRWSRLVGVFSRIDIKIFVFVLIIFIFGQIIMSFRWWLLLRAQSVSIGFKTAVMLGFLGWFYNNFMPGSVGGDLIRAWYVTKHTEKRTEAVISVFVDRVIVGLAGTLLIAVFCYFVFLRGEFNLSDTVSGRDLIDSIVRFQWVIAGAIGIIVLGLLGFLLSRGGRRILARFWTYMRSVSVMIVEKLKTATLIYLTRPLIVLEAVILTVALQIMTITAFLLLGRQLGVNASAPYYYFIFALSWVFGAVPVSVGGAVIVEGLLAYLFVTLTGVEAEAAVALALCQRFVWMLASLPGAVIHLIGAHLPKDFLLD